MDGIVSQIERYCDKLVYPQITVDIFDEVLHTLVNKAQKSTGNSFVFIVNDRLYMQINRALRDYLKGFAQDGTYFFSKKGGKVEVGAEFNSYHIAGNTLTFIPDRCLEQEYSDRGYGIMLDMTQDLNSGRPAMAGFTLRGGEMLYGNLKGLGGQDGRTSGDIATSVMGSSYHLACYSGIAVFNPYRAFILEEGLSV